MNNTFFHLTISPPGFGQGVLKAKAMSHYSRIIGKDHIEIKTGLINKALEIPYDNGFPEKTEHTLEDIRDARNKTILFEAKKFLQQMEWRINKNGVVVLEHY